MCKLWIYAIATGSVLNDMYMTTMSNNFLFCLKSKLDNKTFVQIQKLMISRSRLKILIWLVLS